MKNHVVCRKAGVRKNPDNICAEIIKKVFKEKTRSLIAIGGPGGSGKSTFCKKLIELLDGNVSLLSLDDYKTPRSERAELNIFGPHPKANRMELIKEHLASLKSGTNIEKPVYNPVTGLADTKEIVIAEKFIIIDGEISTYTCFQEYIDFSVFIDSDWKTQLNTRITRDIEKRKYSKQKAISTFLKSNLEEFVEYGAESKKNADLHIFCHSNYQLEIESLNKDLFPVFDEVTQHEYKELSIEGEAVRLIYPIDNNDRPDHDYFLKMIDWLSNKGVKRIIISDLFDLGFLLTKDEICGYIELALEFFPGLVFFETSLKNFSELSKQLDFYARIGVDAFVISAGNQLHRFKELSVAGENYIIKLHEYLNLPVYFSLSPDTAGRYNESNGKIIIESICPSADSSTIDDLNRFRGLLNKEIPGFPAFLRAPCD